MSQQQQETNTPLLPETPQMPTFLLETTEDEDASPRKPKPARGWFGVEHICF